MQCLGQVAALVKSIRQAQEVKEAKQKITFVIASQEPVTEGQPAYTPDPEMSQKKNMKKENGQNARKKSIAIITCTPHCPILKVRNVIHLHSPLLRP